MQLSYKRYSGLQKHTGPAWESRAENATHTIPHNKTTDNSKRVLLKFISSSLDGRIALLSWLHVSHVSHLRRSFVGRGCFVNHSCGHLRRPCNGLESSDRYAASLHPNLIPKCIRNPKSPFHLPKAQPPSEWCIRITSKWMPRMPIRMGVRRTQIYHSP